MNNILKYRGLKNITQKDLALQLKMTRPGLSFVENGNAKNISPERLKKMSEILGVSIVKLLGEENFKHIPETEEDIDYMVDMLLQMKKEL